MKGVADPGGTGEVGSRARDEWVGVKPAVGESGTIQTTKDGGKTWTAQTSGTDSNLSGMDFVNETTGWVVGEGGAVVYTNDGGKTWTAQAQDMGLENDWLRDVDFVSDKEGFISGDYGTILHTTDGGKTWKTEASGKQQGSVKDAFYGISFPNSKAAFAVGEWGTILKYEK